MKTRENFTPDTTPLMSIKDMVQQEVFGYSQSTTKEGYYPKAEDSLDELLDKVYGKIEQQALAVYHSNEIWALKALAYSTILKDVAADEATQPMVEELMSPVLDWENKSYDPVARYREKLVADGKPPHSIQVLMIPVIKFVARKGRKRRYSDADVIEHIAYLREAGYVHKSVRNGKVTWEKRQYAAATIYREVITLRDFLTFLNGRDWVFPVRMPELPDNEEQYTPTLSDEDVEKLIYSTIIDLPPANWIMRLAVSTLYGARVSELKDIETDGDTIRIHTRKKGERRRQPIPATLKPIFSVPIEPMKNWKLQYILRSMCKKAEVDLPERAGWHALRRGLVTSIYKNTDAKELSMI